MSLIGIVIGAILLANLAFSLPSDTATRVTRQAEPNNDQQMAARDGRDGRDGLPGPPGPPGECVMSYREGAMLKEEIESDLWNKMVRNGNGTSRFEVRPESCDIGTSKEKPAPSCAEVYRCNPSAASGFYWVESHKVYCDMQTFHCGIKGGWMRIAYVNMSEDKSTCPSPLVRHSSDKNLCGRATDSSITSLTFPTFGIGYNRICGQAVGYQHSSMDGFQRRGSIESHYVDGISITYGSPRQHVWTYAVGLSDDTDYGGKYNCPCAKYPGARAPGFVGEHYYCESGRLGYHSQSARLLLEDPLWDGEGCSDGNGCCGNAGMPWFCRTLPQEAQDDVEVRLCSDQPRSNEDVWLELLELYVQ